MMDKLFLNAQEIAEACDCSKQKAYLIIRQANEELKQKGFLTQQGKLPRKYFLKWSMEKIYAGKQSK